MLKICIGYDPKETVAYHVLCHSILRQASGPVAFIPINRRNIPEFKRGMEDGSTEFSFSRFLTPWLCNYEGIALFLDCDIIVNGDIYDILEYHHNDADVFVVKHDYIPKEGKKFLGNKQHVYPKKNWSSVMLFNCDRCKALSPYVVNNYSGKYLHQFGWVEDHKREIGSLPLEFNHLVGEYEQNPDAKIIHFTLGTPCFKGYEDQEHSHKWFNEMEMMLHAD